MILEQIKRKKTADPSLRDITFTLIEANQCSLIFLKTCFELLPNQNRVFEKINQNIKEFAIHKGITILPINEFDTKLSRIFNTWLRTKSEHIDPLFYEGYFEVMVKFGFKEENPFKSFK